MSQHRPTARNTPPAMIELEHVTKLYRTVIGVNDITMSLSPGAYGLLGPNGSGKTTLLNLITGQLRPTMGRLLVFGESPWNHDGLLERVGLCPAVDPLYVNVSGLDWVRYLLQLHGFSRREASARAAAALERVGMGAASRRLMGTYSLGMRQRVKLAQAFAHDPELLILDEPFNGLDPLGRHEMTALLRQWIRDGKSLILASHILHEVEAISPAFLLICGGRMLASGSAAEIHLLLADIPNEIHVRCDKPKELARRLIAEDAVEAVRFASRADTLIVSTRSPLAVFERLPECVRSADIRVHEVRSADESLHSLFTSLMRIHRGELR